MLLLGALHWGHGGPSLPFYYNIEAEKYRRLTREILSSGSAVKHSYKLTSDPISNTCEASARVL